MLLLLWMAGCRQELVLGPRVDNFALLDEQGNFHELHYYGDASAVVLLVQGVGCPIGRNLIPTLNRLQADFEPRGVRFLGFNASPQDDRESVAREVAEYGLQFPVLIDRAQHIARSLEIRRTAEAIVIDPASWRVVYRGPVDDRLDYEVQRKAPARTFLKDALDGFLSGGSIPPSGPGPGCLIQLRQQAGDPVSYSGTIAPILRKRCGDCHRRGGAAPWALDSYERAYGWAPMIREVLRTRRMPPWRIDPEIGSFPDLNLLTLEEERQIVSWIDAGASRDGETDPLRREPAAQEEWVLGEPDLVVGFKEDSIPSTGFLPYVNRVSRMNNPKGLWLKAVEVLPSLPQVAHHVLAFRVAPGQTGGGLFEHVIGSFAPGLSPHSAPPGTASYLPPQTTLVVQQHYTPLGRAVTNRTRVGFYLSPTPPEQEYKITALNLTELSIPAGARAVHHSISKALERETRLYAIRPHMHHRGRSIRVRSISPDQSEQTLLSVPDFSFDWQSYYRFEEPLLLPAGTILQARAVFDNSARNRFNPDPSQDVQWGEQVQDEMLLVYFYYTDSGAQPAQSPPAQSVSR